VRDAALRLLRDTWDGERIRLLGVGVTGLEDHKQMDLFSARRNMPLDHTLDALRKRFGPQAIKRGAATTLRDLDWRGDDLRTIAAEPDDESLRPRPDTA
jgi:hypothetical protein